MRNGSSLRARTPPAAAPVYGERGAAICVRGCWVMSAESSGPGRPRRPLGVGAHGWSRPPTWEQLVVIGDAQEEGQVVADVAALGVYEDVPAQAKAAASRGEKRFVPEGSAPKAAS